MKAGYKILLHCILPLIAGALVYVLFHPTYSFLFNTSPFFLPDSLLKKIFVYSLPDFFWDYSLASALYLYAVHFTISYKKIQPVILLLIIGAEVVQLFVPRYFTFDSIDILVAVTAILLAKQFNNPAYEKYTKDFGV